MTRRLFWQDVIAPRSDEPVSEEGESLGGAVPDVGAELELDFDPDELRDFLAADALDVGADPAFKERLRRELWQSFLARFDTPPDLLPH